MLVSYCASVPLLLIAALKVYTASRFYFGLTLGQSQAIALFIYLGPLMAVNALAWSIQGRKEAADARRLLEAAKNPSESS